MSRVFSATRIISATPVIDTNAYATGDQLGSLMTLENVVLDLTGSVTLMDVSLVDKAKQNASIDLLFFKSAPTLTSVDNGAFDISDANLVDIFMGVVKFTSANYSALNVNSVATTGNLGVMLTGGAKNIYVHAVIRSTATYASTTDLQFIFKFYQDL